MGLEVDMMKDNSGKYKSIKTQADAVLVFCRVSILS